MVLPRVGQVLGMIACCLHFEFELGSCEEACFCSPSQNILFVYFPKGVCRMQSIPLTSDLGLIELSFHLRSYLPSPFTRSLR